MRILFVNKFAFNRGGQERVVFDEIEGLRARGHDVELFSTSHVNNLPWRYEESFAAYREIGVNSKPAVDTVLAMFWNAEAARSLTDVMLDFKPDVVHFHGIHRHLTPSVVRAAHRLSARTVMTLHDYWPVCPCNVLLREGTTICEPNACGRLNAAAITNRCVQQSVPRSVVAAVELTWQRATRSYERYLDALISPSRFLRERISGGGFSTDRFEVVPNAVAAAHISHSTKGAEGLLFAGRLSPEKGLSTLIPAAKIAGVKLVVAGEGPMRSEIERLPFVEYLGMLNPDKLAEARKRTVGAIVPSVWFENAPMAILESMACGRPVIATEIGGIPELMRDGVDGLLVKPTDGIGLAEAMRLLVADPEMAAAMGESARLRVAAEYSPERHCRHLESVYEGTQFVDAIL